MPEDCNVVLDDTIGRKIFLNQPGNKLVAEIVPVECDDREAEWSFIGGELFELRLAPLARYDQHGSVVQHNGIRRRLSPGSVDEIAAGKTFLHGAQSRWPG